ncbi:MAG TPA: hypothetical protein PK523_10330, partial [Elusimicrobiales bacterium]|nr:hypothetical protein [Elusimicrobiales bacterium]
KVGQSDRRKLGNSWPAVTKTCGCGRIALEVSKNNAMAIAFYRKHGFETVKERDGILVMRKRI